MDAAVVVVAGGQRIAPDLPLDFKTSLLRIRIHGVFRNTESDVERIAGTRHDPMDRQVLSLDSPFSENASGLQGLVYLRRGQRPA